VGVGDEGEREAGHEARENDREHRRSEFRWGGRDPPRSGADPCRPRGGSRPGDRAGCVEGAVLAVEVGLVDSDEGEVVTVVVGDAPRVAPDVAPGPPGAAVRPLNKGGRCWVGSRCRRPMHVPEMAPGPPGVAVRSHDTLTVESAIGAAPGADTATSTREAASAPSDAEPVSDTAGEMSRPCGMAGSVRTGGT
jgi:hypothetical protein